MKFFLYSIFFFVLAPCNGAKKIGNAQASKDLSKVVITYQRSVCYGKCPVYTITISGATNTIEYKGESNVDKIGAYSKSISTEDLAQLVTAFEKIGFNNLNDTYLGAISDFPDQFITYTNNGKTKKIQDRSGAPKELTSLEKTLEAIANGDGWKKTEDAH